MTLQSLFDFPYNCSHCLIFHTIAAILNAVKAMKATQKTPSSSMKSMNVKKDAGNKDKNKDKGAKSKKLSLEEKIELWREKNKDEASDAEQEPGLSHEEWQKVNGRFKTAMNKHQIAKDAWENASNLSKGNVQKEKKAMVAWLDPPFGKGFQQYIQTVSYDQRQTTTEKPETFKQLLERYDEEEIVVMVDAWYCFSTCFSYLHCLKHATSYLYTCQFCWSDEWHLHMFTLNHC